MSRLLPLVLLPCTLCASLLAAEEVLDSNVVAPEAHQVILENEHVRVSLGLASHGHVSPMHSHPARVIVSLGTARIRVTFPDGTQRISDLRPGTVLWSDPVTHSWELLAGEVDVVAVEVKAAAPAAD